MKPKVDLKNLPLNNFEKQLNWLAAGVTVGHLLLIGFNYTQLPDQVPIHFDITGKPDSYGSKNTIWIIVGLAIIMYFFMRFQYRDNKSNQIS